MEDIETLISDMRKLKKDIAEIKSLIKELHAVQFGKLYQPQKEKKPTKKQIEEAKLNGLRKAAHLRMLNRPARKTYDKK